MHTLVLFADMNIPLCMFVFVPVKCVYLHVRVCTISFKLFNIIARNSLLKWVGLASHKVGVNALISHKVGGSSLKISLQAGTMAQLGIL